MVTVSCWADVYACVRYTEDLRMYMCGCSSLDNPGWIMTISYGLWLRLFLLLLNVPLILKVTARRLRDLPIPRFLPTPVNVTFTKGEVAVLQCSMENLGARLVVWRKASEPNPLTIGLEPFIDNPRISVIHDKSRQHWELHIKNVQPSHAGVYECQISSKHDLIRLIMLRVNGTKDDPDIFHEDSPSKIKPSIHISGTKVVHVGQTIKLQCNVTGWVESFRAVDWFKDGDRIIPTIGNKVTISKFEVTGTNTFTSYLEIKHSKKSDSGTYLCWTSADIDVARMHVDVLNTESINKKRGGSGQAGTAAPHNGAKFGSSRYLLTFTTILVTICRLCGS